MELEEEVFNNRWLTNKEFINKINFVDKYYLENLFNHVNIFLQKCPVPVVTMWDEKNKWVYFKIGNHKCYVPVDMDISYFDYITLIEKRIKRFYPKYTFTTTTERPLTTEEVAELVKTEGMDFNEALNMTKVDKKTETGIIERIYLMDDHFRININGQRYIRVAKYPVLLSQLLKTVRKLKDSDEKRAFIMENSRMFSKKNLDEPIHLDYKGKKLLNFFKINVEDLYQEDLVHCPDFTQFEIKRGHKTENVIYDEGYWKWGRYYFNFNSSQLCDDCIDILENYRKSLLINSEIPV